MSKSKSIGVHLMNTKEFHLTTGKELLAIKDRVRNLILHWGEDGRYKEAVLKTVIQRFIPEKFAIATGFVIKQTNTRGEHLSSTQIDLLIYDKAFPILFKEADFAIVTPDSVRGIIEVKANVENQNLEKIVTKSNVTGKFIYEGKVEKSIPFFNGIFSYEGFDTLTFDKTEHVANPIVHANEKFKNDAYFSKSKVNHICLNKDWFLKYWEQELPEYPHYLYKIKNLSFSFFISNLIDFLSDQSVIENSNLWFPVDKGPEVQLKF